VCTDFSFNFLFADFANVGQYTQGVIIPSFDVIIEPIIIIIIIIKELC